MYIIYLRSLLQTCTIIKHNNSLPSLRKEAVMKEDDVHLLRKRLYLLRKLLPIKTFICTPEKNHDQDGCSFENHSQML